MNINNRQHLDVILTEDDVMELRIYKSAAGSKNFCVDVNGITILRVGNLPKGEPVEIKDER